jgi:hypothetical protein
MSNSKILIFKRSTSRMETELFQKMAETLQIKGKIVETENAIAINDSNRIIVYAQPSAKFAGLLFYNDQSKGIADPIEKIQDNRKAKSWADMFMREFNLLPSNPKDERIKLAFSLSSTSTDSIVFDGKERKKVKNKVEIKSEIKLNEIPVVGPRAKTRMIFKDQEKPILIHNCLWDRLEVDDERDPVGINEVVKAVKEKLMQRRSEKESIGARRIVQCEVVSTRLAYFANEYAGGPDLLAPYYFIEVEFEDPQAKKNGIEHGPKQMFWVPAYR